MLSLHCHLFLTQRSELNNGYQHSQHVCVRVTLKAEAHMYNAPLLKLIVFDFFLTVPAKPSPELLNLSHHSHSEKYEVTSLAYNKSENSIQSSLSHSQISSNWSPI